MKTPLLSAYGSQWLPIPLEDAVTSHADQRSAGTLEAILDQFHVEDSPRYRPLGNTTYCNIFAWDVTRAMNAEIPHWVDQDWLPCSHRTPGGRETTVNLLFPKLVEGMWGWSRCDRETAAAHARNGFPVVAAWKNPSGPGHIAVLTPSPAGEILVAQAGSVCSRRMNVERAFGTKRDVWYFRHD